MSRDNASFITHLAILRDHIIRSVIYICVFAVIALIFSSYIYDYVLFAPKSEDFLTYRALNDIAVFLGREPLFGSVDIQIQNRVLTGQFSSKIWVSLISGLVLAFPLVLREFWKFIAPALDKKWQNRSLAVIFWLTFLFLLGIVFGYFLIVPISINFFASFKVGSGEQIQNLIELSNYINTVVNIPLATGVMFELPFVILVLSRFGIVSSKMLRQGRKFAVIIILILAAILTPPDVVSQIILAIPALVLYEVGIAISKREEKQPENN